MNFSLLHQINGKNLGRSQHNKIMMLLNNHQDLFAYDKSLLITYYLI